MLNALASAFGERINLTTNPDPPLIWQTPFADAMATADRRAASVGNPVPVVVEPFGSWIEEHEPGAVDWSSGNRVNLGEQRSC